MTDQSGDRIAAKAAKRDAKKKVKKVLKRQGLRGRQRRRTMAKLRPTDAELS